jgi:hypothetical protein
VNAESHSSSTLLTDLLFGAARKGRVFGRHELVFGDYVLSLTERGQPRMPNGVECAVKVAPGARVAIGRGRIHVGDVEVAAGPEWNPVPVRGHFEVMPAGPEPLASSMAMWATSPDASLELIAGYVAGLVLLHGQRKRAERIAQAAMERADPLSATLLRHAARGEVPEPVHAVVASADARPLLACGQWGLLWLRGLISAGLPPEATTSLAPDPPVRVPQPR